MKDKSKLYFLDPHRTQIYSQETNLDQYFSSKVSGMSLNQLGGSLGLCFYFVDLQTLDDFYLKMHQLNQKYTNCFFTQTDLPIVEK
jgi:hypothetical protein